MLYKTSDNILCLQFRTFRGNDFAVEVSGSSSAAARYVFGMKSTPNRSCISVSGSADLFRHGTYFQTSLLPPFPSVESRLFV